MALWLLFHFNCYSALNCSIKCGPWHDGNNGLIRGHFHLIKRNKTLAAVQRCSPRLSLLKAFLSVCTHENWRERERDKGEIQRGKSWSLRWYLLSDLYEIIKQQNIDIQKLSLWVAMWFVLLDQVQSYNSCFLSSSHHYTVASSLTALNLTEVMVLPTVTLRLRDCWHGTLCSCSSMKDYERGGKDFCTFVNIYKSMKVRLGMQGMQVQMGPARMEARRAKGGLLI